MKARRIILRSSLALVLGGIVFFLVLFVSLFGGGGGAAVAASCGPTTPMSATDAALADSPDLSGKDLTGEQIGNARIIIGTGQGMGASAYEVKLAIWTSYQESGLINLFYGTGDSLGLFQQTHFYGTPAQRLNPVYASTKFFEQVFKYRSTYTLSAQDGPENYLDVAVAIQNPLRPLSMSYLSPDHNFLDWEPIVDSILKLVGVNAPKTGTGTQGSSMNFDTLCSSSTDIGVPGLVIIAPGANNPGQPVTPETLAFLSKVAGIYGQAMICTTGTNHSYYTVDGLVSDHASGHACDFGMNANGSTDDGPVGDAIMTACLEAAGYSPTDAVIDAQFGGLFTIPNVPSTFGLMRIQCIWKTYEGGNHHTHVHIGARRPESNG